VKRPKTNKSISYSELHCLSNFSFLRSASQPAELVLRASELGYQAIAITDECSLAGIVKAHVAAKKYNLKLIIGAEFNLQEEIKLVALAPNRRAYSEISGLISLARRRSPKGQYEVFLRDIIFHLKQCLLIWFPNNRDNGQKNGYSQNYHYGHKLRTIFKEKLWLGVEHHLTGDEHIQYQQLLSLACELDIAMVACGDVHMHIAQRKPLLDVLTAIYHNKSIEQLGSLRQSNSQRYLRSLKTLKNLYPESLISQTQVINNQCHFSLEELRHEYPREVVPQGKNPHTYLRNLVMKGGKKRWPKGIPENIVAQIEHELRLIAELKYEYYFLTVYDIVHFARSQHILCQGRGSAANSVVCYCLHITEISPEKISLLFERFISKERDEPPDIDVDFEHERREEVIQYIYKKYTRERAALAATVITYRVRSAIRDVGKALGLDSIFVNELNKSLAWWDRLGDLQQRFQEQGLNNHNHTATLFQQLVHEILGFPRHLSQHVGGFVITQSPISSVVPVENASMPERTVIQWDKEDLEVIGLLKIDVLALGMLSAIRKCLEYIHHYKPSIQNLTDIPKEDPTTYAMLQKADSVGVFQIESRAQMSMLPRLKPQCFYDLVIEIAIVRPGPIQGDMVHPYLRRRDGIEKVRYPSKDIESVLERTLGVPIFQEQVIKLAMVAAGFSGGEADQLRRAMASWGKNGNLIKFEKKLIQGMLIRGYKEEFACQLFEQIKGFGGYGFPESHSASFALIAYSSAWLKCHHPAAFYCALLNSQPMGFYSPSQLIQDAQRHNIKVQPCCVLHSDWQHCLNFEGISFEQINAGNQPALRLGLSIIKGLSRKGADRIIIARTEKPFLNIADLHERAELNKKDMQALASADALKLLSGHRHQTQWQIMALQSSRPLLRQNNRYDSEQLNDNIYHLAPSRVSEVFSDYGSTGLSLREHPMLLLRHQHPFNRCKRFVDLPQVGNKRFVRIAGIVTGRQRPGSASGVLFLTLEDETGNNNVIVWENLQQRFRQALLTAKLLMVKGILEMRDDVTHIIAGELIDYSERLTELEKNSRDFD